MVQATSILLLRDFKGDWNQTQRQQGPVQQHPARATVSVLKGVYADDIGVQSNGEINSRKLKPCGVRRLSQSSQRACGGVANICQHSRNLIAVRGAIRSERQPFASKIRSTQPSSVAPHPREEPRVKGAEELNAQYLMGERPLLDVGRKAVKLTREPFFFGFGVCVYSVERCSLSVPLA